MKINCAACGQPIGAEQIDLPTRTVKCLHCDEIFELTELTSGLVAVPSSTVVRPVNALTELTIDGATLRIQNRPGELSAGARQTRQFLVVWFSFFSIFTSLSIVVSLLDGMPSIALVFLGASSLFWVAGFGILAFFLWETRTQRAIIIDPVQITYFMECGYYKRTQIIRRERLCGARKRTITRGEVNDVQYFIKGVEIAYRFGSIFLPTANDVETDWLLGEFRAFLGVKEV